MSKKRANDESASGDAKRVKHELSDSPVTKPLPEISNDDARDALLRAYFCDTDVPATLVETVGNAVSHDILRAFRVLVQLHPQADPRNREGLVPSQPQMLAFTTIPSSSLASKPETTEHKPQTSSSGANSGHKYGHKDWWKNITPQQKANLPPDYVDAFDKKQILQVRNFHKHLRREVVEAAFAQCLGNVVFKVWWRHMPGFKPAWNTGYCHVGVPGNRRAECMNALLGIRNNSVVREGASLQLSRDKSYPFEMVEAGYTTSTSPPALAFNGPPPNTTMPMEVDEKTET
ncbi:hypothetical protein GGR57DRAFT_510140 [Xylariaceae sp. FL1272]|nr:hypothetical protein GGR57DRAFT_510140 [Xylariaceae sp. FL1272]